MTLRRRSWSHRRRIEVEIWQSSRILKDGFIARLGRTIKGNENITSSAISTALAIVTITAALAVASGALLLTLRSVAEQLIAVGVGGHGRQGVRGVWG